MSAAPKECPQQIGACEKQSHLIQIGFSAAGKSLSDNWPGEAFLSSTCASRNESPLSRERHTPLFLIMGRPNLLNYPALNSNELFLGPLDTSPSQGLRIAAMWEARKAMITSDGSRIISTSSRSPLRTGSSDTFHQCQISKRWSPDKKKWISGMRFLADLGRNIIVEAGAALKKFLVNGYCL